MLQLRHALAGLGLVLVACGDEGSSTTGSDGPDPSEICGNGSDDDGDGQVDEGCGCIAAESCDGADNDCDGEVDEGCACVVGATESCYAGPAGTSGVGRCQEGTRTCGASSDGATSDWSGCAGELLPTDEVCNGEDDDCDGTPDDGLTDLDGDGATGLACGGDDCNDDDPTVYPGAPDAAPVIEVLSSSSGPHFGSALVIDSLDQMHVSYFDNKTPIYMMKAAAWSSAVIGAQVHGPYDTDLALDAQGFVHVVYTHTSYPSPDVEDLRYATNLSGSFQYSTLDGSGDTGYHPSIGVGPDGVLHVAFHSASPSAFRYANNATGSWESTTVDAGSAPLYQSLDVDAAGRVHVGYARYGQSARYAVRQTDGTWTLEDIEPGPDTGYGMSLTLDAAGHAHVAFVYAPDGQDHVLRYATNASGAWVGEDVAPAGGPQYRTSIALTAPGGIAIAFAEVEQHPALAIQANGVGGRSARSERHRGRGSRSRRGQRGDDPCGLRRPNGIRRDGLPAPPCDRGPRRRRRPGLRWPGLVASEAPSRRTSCARSSASCLRDARSGGRDARISLARRLQDGAVMHIAPVRPPRIGSPMSTTGIRLKPLPPPMSWPPRAELPPPPSQALPSYPDPDRARFDDSISLHDGDFEEVFPPAARWRESVAPPPVVYAVYAGREPGELVLRAITPNDPPPEGVLIARLERVHVHRSF